MSFLSFLKSKLPKKRDYEQIAASLNAIYHYRIPLYVDQEDIAYTIAFLISKIDIEHKKLILMSLTPHNHQKIFAKNKMITLATIPNSIKTIKFSCKLQAIEPKNLANYTLEFPKTIETIERRVPIRTKLSDYANLQVIINCARGVPAVGHLYDLSKQGLCICFDEDILTQVKINNALHLCNIQLNEAAHLECQIELIHCYFDMSYQCTYVGAKFIGLTPQQQGQINYLVTQIQLKFYHRYLEPKFRS